MGMDGHASGAAARKVNKTPLGAYLKFNWQLYVMVLPGVAMFLIFSYFPMYGITMAFQQFKPVLGFFHSPWVGLLHFERIVSDPIFFRVFRNTLVLGAYSLIFSFPAPIILALLFNEIRHTLYKRVTQTISYMPFFLSTVIVVGLMRDLLSVNEGVVNEAVAALGFTKINFFVRSDWFRPLYIVSGIWQGVGYSSIIYLAAISGVNPELYEAAVIDGAGRLKQAMFITIPCILPTVTILLIFAVGGLIGADMQKVLLMYSEATYSTADVIGTYVFRTGIEGASQSYASAVGLFNSVISLFLLATTNYMAKRLGETSLW